MLKEVLLASVLAVALAVVPAVAQEPAGEKAQIPSAVAPPAATEAPSQPNPDIATSPDSKSADSEALTGLPIYSSDGKKIGSVTAFRLDANGRVQALQAEIGGFLGFGSKKVEIGSASFQRQGDRVALSMTAEEASKLPEAEQLQ
jgi:sporulation protein YlmC with PRC-barrel domain